VAKVEHLRNDVSKTEP